MQDGRVPNWAMEAVKEGIQELVKLAAVPIEIVDKGSEWTMEYEVAGHPEGSFGSAAWYCEQSRDKADGRIDADSICWKLEDEVLLCRRLGGPYHYNVFIGTTDLCAKGSNFVIGAACKGAATVISVHRFLAAAGLSEEEKRECIITESIHELGHVFGLPDESRGKNLAESLGNHCTNTCIMRQGLRVPDHWVRFSKDRKEHGALCGDCLNDLQRFFSSSS